MIPLADELHLVLKLASVISAIGMIAYVWQYRAEPSTRPFVGMLVSLTVGGTIGVLHLVLQTPSTDVTIWRTWQAYCGLVPFLLFWGIFALRYTGYGKSINRKTEGTLLLVPLYLAVFSTPYNLGWFEAIPEPFGPVLRSIFMLSVPLALSGVIGLVAIGIGLLFVAGRKYAHVNTRKNAVLALAALLPLIANFAISIAASRSVPDWALTIDYYLAGFLAAELLLAVALFHYSVFEELPAAGRVGFDLAIEEMAEGLIVLDHHDRILELNAAAETIFDLDSADVVGKSLEFLLGADTGIVSSKGLVDRENPIEITLPRSDRTFEARVSPIEDQYGKHVGHVVILYDVTNRKIREQQLEVLNRVLRHNLRNEISVVNTYAELLADGSVERSNAASAIESASTEIVEIGNKARTIERIIAEDASEYERIHLSQVVDSIFNHLSEKYPDVALVSEVPEQFTIVSRPQILEPVLRSVVENAAEHNDASQPSVRVAVSPAETRADMTDIIVADNGPGVPDHELEPLRDEAEVPLKHGSGLGLWLAKWGVLKLDGEIEFTENEPNGTRVRISLPSTGPEESANEDP